MTRRRTVGVLGGMGPLATVDLYRKIIEATPARTDQEHLPVIIDADPSVPDRTAALLEGGDDPTPHLIRGLQRLTQAGAAFVVMPCNTAHAFLDQIQPECPVPILSMIDETARVAAEQVAPGSNVGILATRGTIAAGLYQHALEKHGLTPVVPDEAEQAQLMETIYQVKSGNVDDAVAAPGLAAARALASDGAAALLAACTELPVVLRQEHVTVPLIDPTEVLARAAVRAATDDAVFERLIEDSGKAQSHVR